MDAFIDWITSNGLRIGIILLGVWLARKFGNLIIRRAIRRTIQSNVFDSKKDEKQREDTLISVVTTSARVILWLVGGMLIVQEIGIDIGPLVAGASVIGVAIGFGAQSLVKDFVSGLFIIMENQYRVGDVVSIAGVGGVVEAVTMRETVLRDLNGHVHHVPNGLVEVSTNKTMEFSAINIKLGVAYSSDITKVEKVVNEVGSALAEDEQWKDLIIETPKFVRVAGFGASEVEVLVLGKVHAGKQWAVAGEFRGRIKKAFDKNSIEIPFPQLDLHQKK